eukprot:scaffold81434_cov57-Phaeocystis_antarctica.AAC.2
MAWVALGGGGWRWVARCLEGCHGEAVLIVLLVVRLELVGVADDAIVHPLARLVRHLRRAGCSARRGAAGCSKVRRRTGGAAVCGGVRRCAAVCGCVRRGARRTSAQPVSSSLFIPGPLSKMTMNCGAT